MHRMSLAVASATAALAVPAAAQASVSAEVSPRCDAAGNITVQVNHQHPAGVPTFPIDQVNVDGHPAVNARGWAGEKLNQLGDFGRGVYGLDRFGFQVVGGLGAHHRVLVFSKWATKGDPRWQTYSQTFDVDCGTPTPTIVEKVVERIVEKPVPVAPACTSFAKTVQVMSRGRRGHRGAPITRVDTYLDGVLYDRRTASASRKIETRRIKVTGLSCERHTFRVTVSRQQGKRHRTTTVRGVLAPGGLNRTTVDLGVF